MSQSAVALSKHICLQQRLKIFVADVKCACVCTSLQYTCVSIVSGQTQTHIDTLRLLKNIKNQSL